MKGASVDQLANPWVAQMRPYVPGLQPTSSGWVKLNTNENPFLPSPSVVEVIRRELELGGDCFRYYPNPTSASLREALAQEHGLSPNRVIIGNGCDDVLNLVVRAFTGPERLAGMVVPSYSLYGVLCAAQGSGVRLVELDRQMVLEVDRIANLGVNVFFLTNPNAPTGVQFPVERVRSLLDKFSGLLVVDETYAAFADADCVRLLDEYRNLVIVRSFSKSHSLAGLRLGYALADQAVAGLLDRVRDSYNVNVIAQLAGLAALRDRCYFQDCIEKVKRTRDRLRDWFCSLPGWFCFPSSGNFLFVEPCKMGRRGPDVADSLFGWLESRQILVRYFGGGDFTSSFLRISIGLENQMEVVKSAVSEWLERVE